VAAEVQGILMPLSLILILEAILAECAFILLFRLMCYQSIFRVELFGLLGTTLANKPALDL
jgi:hypothetical protein